MTAVVVLTEQALSDEDAARLGELFADDAPTCRVLVPSDTRRSVLADVLDHLSLLELREALEAVRGHDDTTPEEAATVLAGSLAALRAAGVAADGEVVAGDPLAAVERAVTASQGTQETHAQGTQVVVVTRPHAVEDTFHTDWASRLRERLGVPVLHVYAGSSWLG